MWRQVRSSKTFGFLSGGGTHITGGNLDAVLAGIRAALAAGFERLKLNCVLMRGVNE